MAKSNAMKRLERILADEDYGPKLVRLNRTDERHILDMIDSKTHYTKINKEIDRLDAERIAKRRKPARARKTLDIATLRLKAYRNMRSQLMGNPKQITRGVSVMTVDELQLAATGDSATLKKKASIQVGWAIPEDYEHEINPFWYN
jgi:hypothetical protein